MCLIKFPVHLVKSKMCLLTEKPIHEYLINAIGSCSVNIKLDRSHFQPQTFSASRQ